MPYKDIPNWPKVEIAVGWLVVLWIFVAFVVIFQPYRDLEVEDNQSLKS